MTPRSRPSAEQIAAERLAELQRWQENVGPIVMRMNAEEPTQHAAIGKFHRAMLAFRRSEQAGGRRSGAATKGQAE
jgi:hypothetical protein